ncbi:DUF2127 domain-containing protein [Puniceibacterium sp. IMCC21224]|uniref:DUF2127 domain-containing protein n=1 Tax=Puniceibacterium sp. IMCC21224 TaxID=1618204 RepID=UPI00069CD15B|nr:DUF2127 domain-containing protein [Puniceibacterium sp. IMCC21224]
MTKAGVGLLQFGAGLGLSLSPSDSMVRLVDWLTRNRLAADSTTRVLRHWADTLPVQAETFYALYLMGHGALNFLIIFGLVLHLRYAYPVAMLVLSGFVLYQLREFLVGHDPAFLVLCAVDLTVMILISLERLISHRRMANL